ncbi:MAG: sensor histidine kinase [Planctomycetota bacterium]|jgi:signal transduction histidine kinase
MSDPSSPYLDSDSINRVDRLHAGLEGLRSEFDHVQRLATIGTLAAGVAHEVNNILTPALAYLQLAQANPDDRTLADKAIAKALSGIESATHISQALLGFSSDEDEPSRCNVGVIAQAAIDCLGRDPRKDNIDLQVRVPTDLEARMRPHALQQVLLNLILNACKAMGGHPGRVTIGAEPRPDGTTHIAVDDDGPGIPDDIAGRLFEPFVTRRRTSGQQGGSGLGLAVCRHLVEQAGGTIAVESAADRGTTFRISLPTAHAERAKAG